LPESNGALPHRFTPFGARRKNIRCLLAASLKER
jgi:hypothetical protein